MVSSPKFENGTFLLCSKATFYVRTFLFLKPYEMLLPSHKVYSLISNSFSSLCLCELQSVASGRCDDFIHLHIHFCFIRLQNVSLSSQLCLCLICFITILCLSVPFRDPAFILLVLLQHYEFVIGFPTHSLINSIS
jgi:hypothetical protein